ncbi:MAG: ABC transporter ATP-binding protein [Thermodesulfobacteriota bacterium]|nr:ABC transporter ATP-binding protein [Thermodesulfobacteriota bacterium]
MPEKVFQQNQTILETREITMRFGGLEALNALSFSIAPHQIVSVIGPNGAGKTTLLNAITGVYSPNSGEILFRGMPISGLKPFQITARGINRTFQQVQLFSNMTVLENVMVGMHPRTKSGFWDGLFHFASERREEKKIREKAETLLDFFGLLPKAYWMSAHVSIADQKRLEIARAMAGEPELLLLDEPVAGLNIRETEAMGDLIIKLKQTGQTIILVEHNMHLVMGISDWVIVLHHGAKIGEGRPEEMQKDSRVVEAYLGT